jgi:hypothetical protein
MKWAQNFLTCSFVSKNSSLINMNNRVSSVGTDIWLGAGRPEVGGHAPFHPVGTSGSFPGGKAAGSVADNSPPTGAEVKETRIYTSAPPYVFMP